MTFAAGKVGQAFNFNGGNQVDGRRRADLDLTDAVTLEAWSIPPPWLPATASARSSPRASGTASGTTALFVGSDGGLHLSYVQRRRGQRHRLDRGSPRSHVGQFSHVAAVIDTARQRCGSTSTGQLVGDAVHTGGPPGGRYAVPADHRQRPVRWQRLVRLPGPDRRACRLQPGPDGQRESSPSSTPAARASPVPVAVANVAPTPTLSGFGTGLATQVLTYTASATDPSTVDQAAGFAYSINWGDGSPSRPSRPPPATAAASASATSSPRPAPTPSP